MLQKIIDEDSIHSHHKLVRYDSTVSLTVTQIVQNIIQVVKW